EDNGSEAAWVERDVVRPGLVCISWRLETNLAGVYGGLITARFCQLRIDLRDPVFDQEGGAETTARWCSHGDAARRRHRPDPKPAFVPARSDSGARAERGGGARRWRRLRRSRRCA